jgi:hypothetical protein
MPRLHMNSVRSWLKVFGEPLWDIWYVNRKPRRRQASRDRKRQH